MPGSMTIVTPAAITPVSLAEAKLHLRVDTSADDALITAAIQAATDHVESYLSAALITRTSAISFRGWPLPGRALDLLRPPLQSVTSIVYVDQNGDNQTLASTVYDVDTKSVRGLVTLADGQSWPSLGAVPNPITVTYVHGYGATVGTVPQPIKSAILLVLGDLYRDREAGSAGVAINKISTTVEMLLTPYVRSWGA